MPWQAFLVVLLSLLLLPAPARATSDNGSVLGFRYNDVSQCSSTVLQINNLYFDCGGGDGGGGGGDSDSDGDSDSSAVCTTGNEVTITGSFTSTLPIPTEVNAKIQVCKFWGYLCTSYLIEQDVNFCEQLNIDASQNGDNADGYDADYYCAPAGQYDITTSFTLPTSSLADNFAVNGVTFRIYILLMNEITCHAEFTTLRAQQQSQSYTMSYSLLGLAALVLSGFSLHEVRKRQQTKLRVAKVDLRRHEDELQQARQNHNHAVTMMDFETMQDHYVTL